MKKEFKILFTNSQLLNKYINKINKILWILGKNAFSLILIFILLNIIFSAILFYNYVFLVNTVEPQIMEVPTKFKENIYQSVLKEIKIRENFSKSLSE